MQARHAKTNLMPGHADTHGGSDVATPPAAPTASEAGRRLMGRPERRSSILRGAAAAFARSGFTATTMEAIAEASGVSKLILYRHFESKEELYRLVVGHVAQQLAEEFATTAARGEGPGVAARSFLTVAREDPEGFRLLWRHSAREPQFAEYVERFRSLAMSFTRALLAPHVRDSSWHEWAAQTVVDLLVGAVLSWLDHGDAEHDDEFVERTTRALRAVIAAWA